MSSMLEKIHPRGRGEDLEISLDEARRVSIGFIESVRDVLDGLSRSSSVQQRKIGKIIGMRFLGGEDRSYDVKLDYRNGLISLRIRRDPYPFRPFDSVDEEVRLWATEDGRPRYNTYGYIQYETTLPSGNTADRLENTPEAVKKVENFLGQFREDAEGFLGASVEDGGGGSIAGLLQGLSE